MEFSAFPVLLPLIAFTLLALAFALLRWAVTRAVRRRNRIPTTLASLAAVGVWCLPAILLVLLALAPSYTTTRLALAPLPYSLLWLAPVGLLAATVFALQTQAPGTQARFRDVFLPQSSPLPRASYHLLASCVLPLFLGSMARGDDRDWAVLTVVAVPVWLGALIVSLPGRLRAKPFRPLPWLGWSGVAPAVYLMVAPAVSLATLGADVGKAMQFCRAHVYEITEGDEGRLQPYLVLEKLAGESGIPRHLGPYCSQHKLSTRLHVVDDWSIDQWKVSFLLVGVERRLRFTVPKSDASEHIRRLGQSWSVEGPPSRRHSMQPTGCVDPGRLQALSRGWSQRVHGLFPGWVWHLFKSTTWRAD